MYAIETSSLTKSYGKARGITDLNLAVNEGCIYGFIGPNGAGKSTTIRTLLGLIKPTSGSACVLGLDIVRDRTEILSRVGYMPSEASFWNGMRVHEVISLSAAIRKRDCKKRAAELCERFDVDLNKKIDELSLGNRRKVSLVCAMQHNPELCVLDEPTSGLDPLMQKEFFELIREQNRAGSTIFLSSHVLSEVQRYCDFAGIVREGKLIRTGTVAALTGAGVKKVVLHGIHSLPENVPGIINPTVAGDRMSFMYGGEPSELIRFLASLSFTDVTVSEPDLEEMFLHYYSNSDVKEGERA